VQVSLFLDVDSLYTLTTLTTGNKGTFSTPPPPAVFPAAHVDDFNACAESAEPPYWSDQNGAFECTQTGDATHSVVMRQMVPLKPVAWGGDIRPHSLLGSRDMFDVSISIDVRITDANGSAIVGARLQGTTNSQGVLWSVNATGGWNITQGMSVVQTPNPMMAGVLPGGFGVNTWHTIRLDVNGTKLNLWVDGAPTITNGDVTWAGASGHTGIGTVQYAHFTEFDNVALYSTQVVCSATPALGVAVKAVPCASEIGPRAGGQLVFTASDPSTCPYGSPCAGGIGTFAVASNPSLCLSASGAASANLWPVVLATCNANDPAQIFKQNYNMLYSSSIAHNGELGMRIWGVGCGV
jgi:hypothetical protein